MPYCKKIIVSSLCFTIGFGACVAAEEADPSPQSADSFVAVPISGGVDVGNIVYSVGRVTDPSTIQPGEPMPGYPGTQTLKMSEFLEESAVSGTTIVLVPTGEMDLSQLEEIMGSSAAREGTPVLVQGGATIEKTGQ